MILYHGSNVEVREPRIMKSNRTLDFGSGFYTTTNRDQAADFARRVTGNRGYGVAKLNVYRLDETVAFDMCDALQFQGVCDAWLDYIADNRLGMYNGPAYDLVFGPVANDDVYETLQLYLNGSISRDYTMQRLKVKKLFNQLVFKSARSLGFLAFVKSEDV